MKDNADEQGNRLGHPTFTFPAFGRLKSMYKNLVVSYADDARSKYLSRQMSKLSLMSSMGDKQSKEEIKSEGQNTQLGPQQRSQANIHPQKWKS